MKQIGGTVFDPQKKMWSMKFEVNMGRKKINTLANIGNKHLFSIQGRVRLFLSSEETEAAKKEVMDSQLFRKQLEKINQWEKEQKEKINVTDVHDLGELEGKKHVRLLGFRIVSPVSKRSFMLEEETNPLSSFDESTFIVLPVEKNGNEMSMSSRYHVQVMDIPKDEPICIDHYAIKHGSNRYFFSTYRHYMEDVIKHVMNEPALKVKQMFWE